MVFSPHILLAEQLKIKFFSDSGLHPYCCFSGYLLKKILICRLKTAGIKGLAPYAKELF